METVFGFFRTEKMEEMRKDGIMNFTDFSDEMRDIFADTENEAYADLPRWEDEALWKIMLAMFYSDKIYFICDGLDLAYRPQPTNSLFSDESPTFTMTEYYIIVSTKSFSDKTVFIGKPENQDADIYISESKVETIAAFKSEFNIK